MVWLTNTECSFVILSVIILRRLHKPVESNDIKINATCYLQQNKLITKFLSVYVLK